MEFGGAFGPGLRRFTVRNFGALMVAGGIRRDVVSRCWFSLLLCSPCVRRRLSQALSSALRPCSSFQAFYLPFVQNLTRLPPDEARKEMALATPRSWRDARRQLPQDSLGSSGAALERSVFCAASRSQPIPALLPRRLSLGRWSCGSTWQESILLPPAGPAQRGVSVLPGRRGCLPGSASLPDGRHACARQRGDREVCAPWGCTMGVHPSPATLGSPPRVAEGRGGAGWVGPAASQR